MSACWLVKLGGGQFIAQRLSQTHSDQVRSCRPLITSMVCFSQCVWGWAFKWSGESEAERSQDLFGACSLCGMAGCTHLDGQTRTRPQPAAIAACFTDLVQTRRTALHEPLHSNSATFYWLTIGTGAWESDRSPTTSTSTGRLCITPVVVPLFLVVVTVASAAAVVVDVVVSYSPPL